MTTCLAIDTNQFHIAYCKFVDGVPRQFGSMETSVFMEWFIKEVAWLDHVAIEMPRAWSNQKGSPGAPLHFTLIAIGRVWQVAFQAFVPVTLVPVETKQLVICGQIRGVDKAAMNRELRRLYGDESKTGKGTKKNPSLLYHCKDHCYSALAVGHTWKVLYPIGDLDNETFIRPDRPIEDGEPYERRKSDKGPGKLIDWEEDDNTMESIPVEIPDRLKGGKCANAQCAGGVKPGSCKCRSSEDEHSVHLRRDSEAAATISDCAT